VKREAQSEEIRPSIISYLVLKDCIISLLKTLKDKRTNGSIFFANNVSTRPGCVHSFHIHCEDMN